MLSTHAVGLVVAGAVVSASGAVVSVSDAVVSVSVAVSASGVVLAVVDESDDSLQPVKAKMAEKQSAEME